MIPFLKYKYWYLLFSFTVIVLGLVTILTGGFRYSIEFVGGTQIQYRTQPAIPQEAVLNTLQQRGIEPVDLRVEGETVTFRSKPITEKEEAALRQTLGKEQNTKISVLRVETVGPSLSADTVRKTAIAAGIAVVGILFYIAYAFKKLTFALAAVIALLHDLAILIGVYALISRYFGAEVDTLFVTAALTTMSFSVHDTIVMFDQLRHNLKKSGGNNLELQANTAITETMVRSLNNSLTVVFMLVALILLGGETIRFFAVALLVGTVTGTYSSPFIAMNVLTLLEKRSK